MRFKGIAKAYKYQINSHSGAMFRVKTGISLYETSGLQVSVNRN